MDGYLPGRMVTQIKRVNCLLCLGIFAATIFGQTQSTLWDDEHQGFLRRGIALRSAPFDAATIIPVCKEVLTVRSGGFIQVTVLPEKQTALPLHKPDHLSFESWKRWHDASEKSQGPIAEMISVDGNSILRLRDLDGHISEVVLQGKNPLTVGMAQILYFGFSGSTPGLIQPARVDIFVKSNPLIDMEAARSLLKAWADRFPEFSVSLRVREDMWFTTDWTFPFFFPFGEDGKPPAQKEYAQTHTIMCSDNSCRVF